jgi:hypothetical protein
MPRSTKDENRIFVAWLDDKIEDYTDYIANLTLNNIVCFACKTGGELMNLLASQRNIDVVILDLKLAGHEKGENFVKTIHSFYPQKAMVIFSAIAESVPASVGHSVERLKKPMIPDIEFGKPDLLTRAIKNALEFRHLEQRQYRTLNLFEKLKLLPWDFLLSIFVPLQRPILGIGLLFLGALQIFAAAGSSDLSSPSADLLPLAWEIFLANRYVAASAIIATIIYVFSCPNSIRGVASRRAFYEKWRPKYMLNAEDRARIDTEIGQTPLTSIDDRDAIASVNSYFERIRVKRTIFRYLTGVFILSTYVFFALSTGMGAAQFIFEGS